MEKWILIHFKRYSAKYLEIHKIPTKRRKAKPSKNDSILNRKMEKIQ